MRLGIIVAVLALTTAAVISCVGPAQESTETWCYYDASGLQVCKTCSGSSCVCAISSYDLCNFGVWERACRSCYEGGFYQDLYYDSRFSECSPGYVCALCAQGQNLCGPYPRPYWIPPPRPLYPPQPIDPSGPGVGPEQAPYPAKDFKQKTRDRKKRS